MATVYNQDVGVMCRLIARMRHEIAHCVSASLTEMNSHDQARCLAHLSKLKSYKAWSNSEPEPDWPETHPLKRELPEPIDYPDVENDDCVVLLDHLRILDNELVNSQSARRGSGLALPDSSRFDSTVARYERYLSDVVANANPIDFPESAPMRNMVAAGRTGVGGPGAN